MVQFDYGTIRPIHNHLQYSVQSLCYVGMGLFLGRKYQQILPFALAGCVTATAIYKIRKRGRVCMQEKTLIIAAKCVVAASAIYLSRKRMGGNYLYVVLYQGLCEFGIATGFSIIDRIFFVFFRVPYMEKNVGKLTSIELTRLACYYHHENGCSTPTAKDLIKSFDFYTFLKKEIDENDKLAKKSGGGSNVSEFLSQVKEEIFQLLIRYADHGHVDAQLKVAELYFQGKETSQDLKKAFDYLKLAADQGNHNGQFRLGMMYYHGNGIPRDKNKAFDYLKLAADQGNPNGQFRLGMMYYHGNEIPRDENKAFEYLKLAADQGNGMACHAIGAMYSTGIGTGKDEAKAQEYSQKAEQYGLSE